MTALQNLNHRIHKLATLLQLHGVESAIEGSLQLDSVHSEDSCLLIKGNNLTALTSLTRACESSIDFCYIDPPYNTGQQFVYRDDRTKASSGIWRTHHDWMAFMLPRLTAAQLLLQPGGVIAISIDDYEYTQLKVLMDNIFGEENYLATLVVCRSKNGKGSKQHVAVNHEYVLLYGKSRDVTLLGLEESETRVYDKRDEHGEFTLDGLFRKKGDASLKEDRPNMHYPLYYSPDGKVFTENIGDDLKMVLPRDSKGIDRRWLWGIDKARTESWKLYASPKGVIYVKNYNTHNKRVKLRSILDSSSYLTDRATTELKEIFHHKVFETPKPISLIRDLIDCCSHSNATILDFFAGTGTTAEAAWELNQRDGSNRKVILIEQTQVISADHIARRSGFERITDITEHRLKHIQRCSNGFTYTTLTC
ncbi:site-specific DNA-methyltransferase [Burkholderia stagnalis]|uniref:site-specific DNA-methyltransferase n=1 Tax=Burkholderia stagnalis TaxID=1503054 RepID=UPI0009C09D4F|nr:site-specific DNA-methyltransferase [Burkholderia stagnalis]